MDFLGTVCPEVLASGGQNRHVAQYVDIYDTRIYTDKDDAVEDSGSDGPTWCVLWNWYPEIGNTWSTAPLN